MKILNKLTIRGFKSIQNLEDFELGQLNIIVGANGAGKSNLISFFKMMKLFMAGNLRSYVNEQGGAGDLMFNGIKETDKIDVRMFFKSMPYSLTFVRTLKDELIVEREEAGEPMWRYTPPSDAMYANQLSLMTDMAAIAKEKDGFDPGIANYVYDCIEDWKIYHFHDTSSRAKMRGYEIVQDDDYLREDAANIAPFLLKLKQKHQHSYVSILKAVQTVLPYISDFNLTPREMGPAVKVALAWFQKGTDYPMQPYHLSDGAIRFICLATALLQPSPPSMIIIDEPELGLHPEAIALLAELIISAAKRTQVIIATQSPLLLNYFSIQDIVVTKRIAGSSVFERLNESDYTHWLENFNLGELWTKNVIEGGIFHE